MCIDCGARVKSIGSRSLEEETGFPRGAIFNVQRFSASAKRHAACSWSINEQDREKETKTVAPCNLCVLALRKLPPPLMTATRNLERRTVSQTALDYGGGGGGGSTTIFLTGVEYSPGK